MTAAPPATFRYPSQPEENAMLHIVHLIQKRHPEHAGKVVALLAGASAALLAAGAWLLLR